MDNRSNKYVQEFLNSNYYAIFLVHRRVMTVLYKKYLLTGYEIELLLMIGKLCNYRTDVEIVGSKIRAKCSMRFQAVLGAMLLKLVGRGFIEDRRKEGATKQAWHYLSLTDLGIEFLDLWKKTLMELVQEEKDQLIISISNVQQKDSKKLRSYSVRRKKDIPPPAKYVE